jgi:hypothetical protein
VGGKHLLNQLQSLSIRGFTAGGGIGHEHDAVDPLEHHPQVRPVPLLCRHGIEMEPYVIAVDTADLPGKEIEETQFLVATAHATDVASTFRAETGMDQGHAGPLARTTGAYIDELGIDLPFDVVDDGHDVLL